MATTVDLRKAKDGQTPAAAATVGAAATSIAAGNAILDPEGINVTTMRNAIASLSGTELAEIRGPSNQTRENPRAMAERLINKLAEKMDVDPKVLAAEFGRDDKSGLEVAASAALKPKGIDIPQFEIDKAGERIVAAAQEQQPAARGMDTEPRTRRFTPTSAAAPEDKNRAMPPEVTAGIKAAAERTQPEAAAQPERDLGSVREGGRAQGAAALMAAVQAQKAGAAPAVATPANFKVPQRGQVVLENNPIGKITEPVPTDLGSNSVASWSGKFDGSGKANPESGTYKPVGSSDFGEVNPVKIDLRKAMEAQQNARPSLGKIDREQQPAFDAIVANVPEAPMPQVAGAAPTVDYSLIMDDTKHGAVVNLKEKMAEQQATKAATSLVDSLPPAVRDHLASGLNTTVNELPAALTEIAGKNGIDIKTVDMNAPANPETTKLLTAIGDRLLAETRNLENQVLGGRESQAEGPQVALASIPKQVEQTLLAKVNTAVTAVTAAFSNSNNNVNTAHAAHGADYSYDIPPPTATPPQQATLVADNSRGGR
jgi:hypothetical protein